MIDISCKIFSVDYFCETLGTVAYSDIYTQSVRSVKRNNHWSSWCEYMCVKMGILSSIPSMSDC